jgi:hypothetical protein
LDNIPEQLQSGLENVLTHSLNEFNRRNKREKIAFSSSEDALTWTFFNYFVVNNKITDLLELLNIESQKNDCEIYLWGVNICSENIETELYKDLIKVSDCFKEDSTKRSEPDVIINLDNKLIFIEVKYRSKNEIQSDKTKFAKYKILGMDFDKAIKSGHYELVRNWAFASQLSNGRDFELINLCPERLFNDTNKLDLFEQSINNKKGVFRKISWEQMIDNIKKETHSQWFIDYLYCKIFNNHKNALNQYPQ